MKRIIRAGILFALGGCILLLFYAWQTRSAKQQSVAAANPTSLPSPTVITATATPKPTEAVPTFTPTMTSTATPGIGSSRISAKDQMEQVFVPAGPFLMGSTDLEAKIYEEDGRSYPEIPQHTVTLEDFWIDKFELTNGRYELCVNDGACTPPFINASETHLDYFGNPEFSNYPVVWVSWYQARNYCEWAGRRLPTEAEWEKAARGTDGQKYPWGNEPITGERANLCDVNCPRSIANPIYDDGYADVAPIGSYPTGVSPYGAMDMAGNVFEWTSTLIYPYPYDANDGREDPDSTWERVWRSSPWGNGFWWLRTTVRYRSVPVYQRNVLGFRCASSE